MHDGGCAHHTRADAGHVVRPCFCAAIRSKGLPLSPADYGQGMQEFSVIVPLLPGVYDVKLLCDSQWVAIEVSLGLGRGRGRSRWPLPASWLPRCIFSFVHLYVGSTVGI